MEFSCKFLIFMNISIYPSCDRVKISCISFVSSNPTPTNKIYYVYIYN